MTYNSLLQITKLWGFQTYIKYFDIYHKLFFRFDFYYLRVFPQYSWDIVIWKQGEMELLENYETETENSHAFLFFVGVSPASIVSI